MAALRGYVGDREIKFCDHTVRGSCIASRDLIRNAGSYHIPLHCTN
jgi:hypothetical protein